VPITNSLRETVFATAYDVSLETVRKSYLEPEQKLMLAVLDNAIACFQKYAFTRDRKGKVLFQRPNIGFKTQTAIGRFRLPTSAKP
jgi:hypothetical protein